MGPSIHVVWTEQINGDPIKMSSVAESAIAHSIFPYGC